MSTLEFVAELVKALAWPLFAIGVVLVLRAPVRDLIPLLRKLKYGDIEAEFGEQVRAIPEELGLRRSRQWQWPGRTNSDTHLLYKRATIPIGRARELLELAQTNPRSAVLEAWDEVEEALQAAAAHLSQNKAQLSSDDALRRVAKEIEPKEVALYYELRKLRNLLAHASDQAPTADAALEYVVLCAGLVAAFRRIAGEDVADEGRVLY
jgi:hypothetical protein